MAATSTDGYHASLAERLKVRRMTDRSPERGEAPFELIRFRETSTNATGSELLLTIFPALSLLILPRAWADGEARGPVLVDQNLTVGVVTCPPGLKPPLHMHRRFTKAFLCLSGRFLVRTRAHDVTTETVLEPLDLLSVAPGVYRDFVNLDEQPARMLVLCFGEAGADDDDVVVDRDESRALARRFGAAALRDLGAAIGYRFPIAEGD